MTHAGRSLPPGQAQKAAERQRLHDTILSPTPALNALLEAAGTTPVITGVRLEELLRRPQLSYAALAPVDPERPPLPALVTEQLEVELKYEGYIRREQAQIDEMRRLENRLLPVDADYAAIRGHAQGGARKSWQRSAPAASARPPASAGSAGGCFGADCMEQQPTDRRKQP